MLHGQEIDDPAAWPANYSSYAVFVCNPASVSAAQLDAARADRPDAVFLAYYCFGWAWLVDDGCARIPENP